MGTWGHGLYDNDTSLDVKDQFEEELHRGKTVEDITHLMINDYECNLDIPYEAFLFWGALADTQWNWGMLLPQVQQQALHWIQELQENGVGLSAEQQKVLDDLRAKLLSPQPPVRKPRKRRLYQCKWQIGDVFAFQMEGEEAKKRNLYGRFFLIQKVSEGTWYPGHIIPIVYVKITKDEKLPSNLSEYNALEFVQTGFTRYEHRFFPLNMLDPQKDIAEKSKIHYEVDEYGFLPQYRTRLISTSAKVIPSKLVYLGNFAEADPPKGEFIPHANVNIDSISWGKSGENFENRMIEKYCGHNLRELKIYSEKRDRTPTPEENCTRGGEN